MCQTANSLTFSGKVTVNGKTTQYNNQKLPTPPGVSNCFSRQGDTLSITTKTPIGTFNNTVKDSNGKINGTLHFPGATVNLNGLFR